MEYALGIMTVAAMLGTLGTLLVGIVVMGKGGNPQLSNKLMRTRVLLQGAALFFFVLFMLAYRR